MRLVEIVSNKTRTIFATVMGLSLIIAAGAIAKVPVERFGELPLISHMTLSPDGTHVAFLLRKDGKVRLLVRDLSNKNAKMRGPDVSYGKARSVSWANNRFVLFRTSKTVETRIFAAKQVEFGVLFSYDTKTGKLVQLLNKHTKDLGLNSSIDYVLRIEPQSDSVIMPAFAGHQMGLFRVDLKTGIGHIITRGNGTHTDGFILDANGAIRARYDYANAQSRFTVYVLNGKLWKPLYSEKSDQTPMSVAGMTKDQKSLVVSDYQGRDTRGLYTMSLADGTISGPLLWRKDADLDNVLVDRENGIVFGAVFADITGADYQFLDKAMQATWNGIKAALGGAGVIPAGWTKDKSKWLLYQDGGPTAGRYLLYDAKTKRLSLIARTRPDIKPGDIADVLTIAYKSKDGTRISALLTTPPGYKKHPAPLVVLPHGGPAAHDSLGWDWLSQSIANQGYLVLQPNFRGSNGFGSKFENAGYGQWNGKVLDDISAGTRVLIKAGYADPKRICIAGASFGGYAALAGLVFTPNLYSCAVAIAPVSDAGAMLSFERQTYGKNSRVMKYWRKVMTGYDGKTDIVSISPANFADAAKAPLLLIHGRDDTVVPIKQSQIMKQALERANKPVQLVELKGEDHWLSSAETRTDTLRAMINFLHDHLDAPAQDAQTPAARQSGGQ